MSCGHTNKLILVLSIPIQATQNFQYFLKSISGHATFRHRSNSLFKSTVSRSVSQISCDVPPLLVNKVKYKIVTTVTTKQCGKKFSHFWSPEEVWRRILIMPINAAMAGNAMGNICDQHFFKEHRDVWYKSLKFPFAFPIKIWEQIVITLFHITYFFGNTSLITQHFKEHNYGAQRD